uniref:Uncharacterized protein n=1 Tax=Arundo donax TaxID=35708 RepID=A0A0A8YMJ4_ARUDO
MRSCPIQMLKCTPHLQLQTYTACFNAYFNNQQNYPPYS